MTAPGDLADQRPAWAVPWATADAHGVEVVELGAAGLEFRPKLVRLTPRVRDVLQDLADHGGPDTAIAARLRISPHTVNTHLNQAMRRFGVRDRAHAVYEGLRSGELR